MYGRVVNWVIGLLKSLYGLSYVVGAILLNIVSGNFLVRSSTSTATALGTAANGVIGIGSGTAPTSAPADMVQAYSADFEAGAGDARLHVYAEAGNPVAIGSAAVAVPKPAAAAGATQAGRAITVQASAAVASTDTAGAAAGGAVNVTAGAAARLTSGNADGGSIVVTPGAGIGTGAAGTLVIRQPGGVAGTDDVRISHDGSIAIFANASGSVRLVSASTTLAQVQTDQTFYAGAFTAISSGTIGFSSSGAIAGAAADSAFNRAAANVIGLVSGDWLQQTPGRSRVTGDVTSSNVTMGDITGLSATLIAGRKYTGFMVLKCSESVAAEGIRVDFNGGTATMTSFAAGAGILEGGTAVKVNAVSSALDTDFDWSTITGETWIRFEITMVVNGAGTFIPRFSQSVDAGGTVTVSLGSYMWLEDMPA